MPTSAVLVTGGAGYIGSHAVLALLETGRPIVVLDDLRTGVREAVPAGVKFYLGSVADSSLVTSILSEDRIGGVIHFAGSVVVPESMSDPGGYYDNNTAASLVLARACVAAGVEHFIFSSTAAVYGEPASCPVPEDAPKAPLSPYGWSKLMTEQMLFDLHRAHPCFRPICLRYFNVAGADPLGRTGQRGSQTTHLVRCAVEAALGLRPRLEVYGSDYPTRDGTCERDFIHVTDLAAAHVAALAFVEAGGAPLHINCGYGRGASVLEVVRAIESCIGRPIATEIVGRRPGDAARVIANVTRARDVLEWKPRHATLQEIVSTALRWEQRLSP